MPPIVFSQPRLRNPAVNQPPPALPSASACPPQRLRERWLLDPPDLPIRDIPLDGVSRASMTIHATARELMTAMSEGVATATLFSMPPPAPLPEYQIQPRDGLAQAAHQQHLTISLLAMDAS